MALVVLALLPLVATARELLGNRVPFEQRTLQIFSPTALPGGPAAALQSVPAGWLATLGGLPVLAGEAAQALGPRGLPWFAATVLLGALCWLGLARRFGWHRPFVPWVLLLALQLFGAAYYLASFRAPPRRLSTSFTAFDFHAHTTRSSGLLSPQQQINWHRARGFRGLAFTDSNRLMPPRELAALQAANPDMVLLNGCEYHGGRAHLILLGLKRAVSSGEARFRRDVSAAVAEAKAQGAVVIVAHPWEPGRYTPQQFVRMGVDGFEVWNGRIWDRGLALLNARRRLLSTSATDTLSKSGARCYTWTLLPPGLKSADEALNALRRRQTAVASALDGRDTFAAYQARRARDKSPLAVPLALRDAWNTLTGAQRVNAVLGLVAALALLVMWSARDAERAGALSGPQRAVGFLRRRRLVLRLAGVLVMLLAFAGSVAAVLALSWTAKTSTFGFMPAHVFFCWLVLDALFLYGCRLWRRMA